MERIYKEMQTMAETAIDKMKTSADSVPVILIGGGSIILADELAGVSEIVQPHHFEVANGIGAAIAQIGGQVEEVYYYDQISREEAIKQSKKNATDEAIAAGADPDTTEIVEMEEIPLTQLGNTSRIKVKAAGGFAGNLKI